MRAGHSSSSRRLTRAQPLVVLPFVSFSVQTFSPQSLITHAEGDICPLSLLLRISLLKIGQRRPIYLRIVILVSIDSIGHQSLNHDEPVNYRPAMFQVESDFLPFAPRVRRGSNVTAIAKMIESKLS